MTEFSTTRLSSKGQVVIPEEIRARLGLKPGAQFVVIGDRDVVILKALATPAMSDFDALVREARQSARRSKLKRDDVRKAVRKARARR
jgi:AbrB family looped-hinge helix DNA binding protein